MAARCSFVLILLDGQAVLNVEVRDDCLVGFGLEELIQAQLCELVEDQAYLICPFLDALIVAEAVVAFLACLGVSASSGISLVFVLSCLIIGQLKATEQ